MHRLLLRAGLALFLSLTPTVSSAEAIQDFAARAEAAADLARRARVAPSRERMDEVREALALPAEFVLHGRPILVPEDPFLETLDGRTAAEFDLAARHLATLAERFDAATGATAARGLRADLEAAYVGIDVDAGLFEAIRRRLMSLLAALFRGAVSLDLGSVGGWLVILALLAVTVWLLRRVGLRPVPEAAVRDRRRGMLPADWRRAAEEAMALGEHRQAVVALYRATVATLAERGVVDDRPSLTAGELRAAARASPAAGLVAQATRRYERVRYGMIPATEEDVAALLAAEREVRAV